MKNILNRIKCYFLGHDWTCDAKKGIEPSKYQLDAGVRGFADYAKMYCDRCGKLSKLNNRLNG